MDKDVKKNEDFAKEAPEKPDTFYSEELSRAAVGRLWDDDDSPPPVKSAFVTGFDRAPAPEKPANNPTKKRDRPPRDRERFQTPPEPEQPEQPPVAEEPEREEAPVERHRRRETATTRLLSSEEPDRRKRNPAPKPAVRVNVPTERRVREGQPGEPQPEGNEPVESDDLDAFRRRFNSGELFSPPRNPNRPRKGRVDVRKDRIRAGDRDADTISPARIILTVTAIVILATVSVLIFQLISFRGRYLEVYESVSDLEIRLAAAQTDHGLLITDMEYRLANAHMENRDLRALLADAGLDPDAPPEENGLPGLEVPDTPTPTTPTGQEWPITYVIVAGDSIARIANRFYGNSNPATVEHIRASNNIPNVNQIQVGQTLTLTAMD